MWRYCAIGFVVVLSILLCTINVVDESDDVELFGINRSAKEWSINDSPIITSNGLDMSSSFQQDGIDDDIRNQLLTTKLWGDKVERHGPIKDINDFSYNKRVESHIPRRG